ncbi:two-component sensor histidine kinase [Microtetraspora sp. NBRC 13810]|uniref:sensor histidine kinase n=1 Tax=Microtetraspora sp. NBRC 13810 TaxID=3030990 RepID=UPI00249FA2C9|nr:HAMP domain-containing sensor histidine kinase [Microtetraspora sp. NBRC 13810]GLW06488.1 two-component sensor histidine kinase [Microtetraspora sp. NBRC 13810]
MSPLPRPHSIRARFTIAAAALSLVAMATLGASFDVAIRYRVQSDAYNQAERVASQWSAAVRNGFVPQTIPTYGRVDLVQLVDAKGQVVDASRMASRTRPISLLRPPADDRFQKLTECAAGHCVVLMAIRISPSADSPVVYAGLAEPSLLATNALEYSIAIILLLVVALAVWTTWSVVGRTLRPVAAIRARMAEITVSDLSLRVPVPPGGDEIALLAGTANQTLARLESAVEQQRQFASTASHELRTPLAGLRTQLEEALYYPGEVDPHDTIRSSLSVTDRLEAIVNDLLALARLRAADPAPPEAIDLGALVSDEIAYRELRVATSVRAMPDVKILGSRMQLIRVLDNLLTNAQRHADKHVVVHVYAAEDDAVVEVIDDGVGIAPADRERVFERFIRLDDGRRRDPGGSGLGLAISRDIAQAHQGTLRVEDSAQGARFVLRLPSLSAQACREAQPRTGGGPGDGPGDGPPTGPGGKEDS